MPWDGQSGHLSPAHSHCGGRPINTLSHIKAVSARPCLGDNTWCLSSGAEGVPAAASPSPTMPHPPGLLALILTACRGHDLPQSSDLLEARPPLTCSPKPCQGGLGPLQCGRFFCLRPVQQGPPPPPPPKLAHGRAHPSRPLSLQHSAPSPPPLPSAPSPWFSNLGTEKNRRPASPAVPAPTCLLPFLPGLPCLPRAQDARCLAPVTLRPSLFDSSHPALQGHHPLERNSYPLTPDPVVCPHPLSLVLTFSKLPSLRFL